MFRAIGMQVIHGITQDVPLPFTVLVATLTRRHPCDVTVAEVAAEFAQIFSFLEGDSLPVSEDEMWWKDIQNAAFPAATVSISRN
jgi:hypothetical protein